MVKNINLITVLISFAATSWRSVVIVVLTEPMKRLHGLSYASVSLVKGSAARASYKSDSYLIRVPKLLKLHEIYFNKKCASTSTGILSGSVAMPTALLTPTPFSVPQTSAKSSLQPLIT
jgi:hypothetical protein